MQHSNTYVHFSDFRPKIAVVGGPKFVKMWKNFHNPFAIYCNQLGDKFVGVEIFFAPLCAQKATHKGSQIHNCIFHIFRPQNGPTWHKMVYHLGIFSQYLCTQTGIILDTNCLVGERIFLPSISRTQCIQSHKCKSAFLRFWATKWP